MTAARPHAPAAASAEDTGRRRIGLVMSGGGARGFAHIGFLRVLERHGVELDVVAGTSMGAIVGALYAHGYRADDLHELAASVSWRDVIDLSLQAGLLKGEKLRQLLATYLPETFEELSMPLAVTCTDLENGEELTFSTGELIPIVRASACFPGAFEPIEHQGRTLADGGICNNLPVDALAFMRAELTIASDVTAPRRAGFLHADDDKASWWSRMVATVTLERRTPLATVTLRSTDIMMRLLTDTRYVHHPADMRVQHELPEVRLESFWDLDAIVAQGEVNAEAAFRAQPELLERLQVGSGAPRTGRPLPDPDADASDVTGRDANARAARAAASLAHAVGTRTPRRRG